MASVGFEKRFYSVSDLIAIGYGSRSSVIRQIQSGELPAIRSGRKWLIPVDDFDAMVERKKSEKNVYQGVDAR